METDLNSILMYIVLTGADGTRSTKIYRNDDGIFTEDTVADAAITGLNYGRAAWGDYDNDGDLDILETGDIGSAAATAKIFKNNGGVFVEDTVADAALIGTTFGDAVWGDYDNDGDLDIVIVGNVPGGITPSAKVYTNNGGVFAENTAAGLTGVYSGGVAWGDYDNDGYLDILLSGSDGGINRFAKLYRNGGDGTFTEINSGLDSGVSFYDVVWGDYDADGDLDVVLAGSSSYIYSNDDCVRSVAISKKVTPAMAAPGATVTYTLTYSNPGGLFIAENVVISDSVPAGLTVQRVTKSGAALTSGGTPPQYLWTTPLLYADDGGTITIVATVNASAEGVITNTASIADDATSPLSSAVLLIDNDGDGISDSIEGTVDTDLDGTPDYKDTDSDDDSILDSTEGTADTDSDGFPDRIESNTNDVDNDGNADNNDTDSDGDSLLDTDLPPIEWTKKRE